MANTIAVFNAGIWFAFNSLRTVTFGVGIALALTFGQLALETGTIFGLVAAASSIAALCLALWLIWRPHTVADQDDTASCSRQSMLHLQRQARGHNIKRLASGFGAVFGACVILLVSFVVFFGGSPLAGLLFFCSGVMAMRAAWTLFWVQRGARG